MLGSGRGRTGAGDCDWGGHGLAKSTEQTRQLHGQVHDAALGVEGQGRCYGDARYLGFCNTDPQIRQRQHTNQWQIMFTHVGWYQQPTQKSDN